MIKKLVTFINNLSIIEQTGTFCLAAQHCSMQCLVLDKTIEVCSSLAAYLGSSSTMKSIQEFPSQFKIVLSISFIFSNKVLPFSYVGGQPNAMVTVCFVERAYGAILTSNW